MSAHNTPQKKASIYLGLFIVLVGTTIFWLPYVYRSILPSNFELRNYLMQFADWFVVGLIICFILLGEKNKLSTLNIERFNVETFSLGMALGGFSMIYIVFHKFFLVPFLELGSYPANVNDGSETATFGLTFILVFGIFNVLTAGFAEEIIYRGYATERLLMLKANKIVVFLLPLMAFTLMHYRKGIEHMIVVFVVGTLFQWFYMKYRNLTLTIIAHLLIDSLAYLSILLEYFS